VRIITLLFLLSSVSFVRSQTSFDLIANVVESDSDNPLQGALCFMDSHPHIWTVTDSLGRFRLEVPNVFLNDSVTITFIGFKNNKVHARQLLLSNGVIRMKQEAIILDDIIIRDRTDELRKIFLSAVADIPKNYPQSLHSMEVFYRSLSTEENDYTHMQEAHLIIQDRAYSSPIENVAIKVLAYRETEEYGKSDSLTMKAMERMAQRAATDWNVSTNPLYRLYQSNFLRISQHNNTHFHPPTLKKYIHHYEMELIGINILETDTIYHIAFSSGGGSKIRHPSGENYLKINMNNLAIVEYQLTSRIDEHLLHQVKVQFTSIDNRYYPSFIQVVQPRFINENVMDGEYDISQMWIDKIQINKIDKLKPREILDHQTRTIPYQGSWDYMPHPAPESVMSALQSKLGKGEVLWRMENSD
jgi:hypothetical protein